MLSAATLNATGAARSLPLVFEENRGQAPPDVRFLARGERYGFLLKKTEAVLRIGGVDHGATVRMRWGNAQEAQAVGRLRQRGISNYILGSDPAGWLRRIPHFGEVVYEQVWPGVDLVFYGRGSQLEYDFIVAPGGDPGWIHLEFDGVRHLGLTDVGDLLLQTPAGELVQKKPVVTQRSGNGEVERVEGWYVIDGPQSIRIGLGKYDPGQELRVDPLLVYSSFLGGDGTRAGGGDGITDVAVDNAGSVYLAGTTESEEFPVTAGAYDKGHQGGIMTGFVAKLDEGATQLLYATYLSDQISGSPHITVDAAGRAIVAGTTFDSHHPVTADALQPQFGGALDAFVSVLSADGTTLEYSTFLGGTGSDEANDVVAGPAGELYVAGHTDSAGFGQPGGPGGTTSRMGFVVKLDALKQQAYATTLGGQGWDTILSAALTPTGKLAVGGETWSTDFPRHRRPDAPALPAAARGIRRVAERG